jgi:hypothetical protein
MTVEVIDNINANMEISASIYEHAEERFLVLQHDEENHNVYNFGTFVKKPMEFMKSYSEIKDKILNEYEYNKNDFGLKYGSDHPGEVIEERIRLKANLMMHEEFYTIPLFDDPDEIFNNFNLIAKV